MSTRTKLTDLLLDSRDNLLARADKAKDELADVLKWGADHLNEANEQWGDGNISDPLFGQWIKTITTVRIPARTGAIAKAEARETANEILGGIFKGIAILAGAI